MNPLELMAGEMEWAARNVAGNLDFIPDDKLNWKPAPTANSVLEIINHVANPIYGMAAALDGQPMKPQFTPATNREEAKQLVLKGTEAYVAKLRSLSPQDLENKTVTLPFDEIPAMVAAGIPMVDLIHHHGQIAYIQTLLGDTESHLQM